MISVNIGSGIGLLPDATKLLPETCTPSIGPKGINVGEIWIYDKSFSLEVMHLKMLSAKCHPYIGL